MEFSKIKDKSLLASVSLFRELYDSEEEKNINDILFKFIIGVVILDGSFQLNVTEIKNLIEKHYGFNIVDAVIKNTLRIKEKTTSQVKSDKGIYLFDRSIATQYSNINSDIEKIETYQDKIINSLILFIEAKLLKKLDEKDIEKVIQSLISFLLDNSYTNGYTDLISAFIITNENDLFTNNLNQIKEGVILYQGLSYEDSSNSHKIWKDNLNLYLSTENLFNCLGYNGTFYQNIFNDFYSLVKEINSNDKNTGKIKLCFFEETKNEINKFFSNAEDILRGKMQLDYSVDAMKNILQGCNSITNIKDKNILFFNQLKGLGIEECARQYSSLDEMEYNVEDQDVAKELASEANKKGKLFNEEECFRYMKLFTKINILRRGRNDRRFENIRYLYITENSFVKYLGHNNKVKFSETDTSFAKDLDFVITTLWFILNKGFSSKDLPISFNVVTKAKMMISSHLKAKVTKAYDKINKDVEAGKITKELAKEYNHEYRKKAIGPEDVKIENIGETIDFILEENDYEFFAREKSEKERIIEQSQNENTKLKEEVEQLKLTIEKEKIEKQEKEKEEEEQRRAKEELEKERLQTEQLRVAREQYANKMWLKEKKRGWIDFWVVIGFFVCSFMFIFLTILTTNDQLQKKCIKLFAYDESLVFNNYILFTAILAFIILVFNIIIFFMNKDRIKNGCKWIKQLFNRDYEQQQKEFYKEQYISDK